MSSMSYESINKLKSGNTRHQFNILIVDDDESSAEIFGEILSGRGHNITITNEGTLCISKCQMCSYDIIFMDFHLDDMNGVDITDLLKNVCSVKSLIFAVTGDDNVETMKLCKNIGMNGAIIKPLDIDLINKFMNSLELRNKPDVRIIKNMKDVKFKKQLFVF